MKDYKPITIKGFLSSSECEDILRSSLLEYNLERALINGTTLDDSSRKSSTAFIENIPTIDDRLKQILRENISVKGFDVTGLGPYQFTKYSVGEYYHWHTDSDSGRAKNRYCSIVIQLNDEYEGGNLEYIDTNSIKTQFERGIGNLFIFFSDILHRVTSVTSGVRYSLVNWVSLNENKNYKKTLI